MNKPPLLPPLLPTPQSNLLLWPRSTFPSTITWRRIVLAVFGTFVCSGHRRSVLVERNVSNTRPSMEAHSPDLLRGHGSGPHAPGASKQSLSARGKSDTVPEYVEPGFRQEAAYMHVPVCTCQDRQTDGRTDPPPPPLILRGTNSSGTH